MSLGLVLSCGGGGGDDGGEDENCRPQPASIALIGDSTMRGAAEPASPFRTAALLQSALGVPVDDTYAIGGIKIADLLNGRRLVRIPHHTAAPGFCAGACGRDRRRRADTRARRIGLRTTTHQVSLGGLDVPYNSGDDRSSRHSPAIFCIERTSS